MRLAEIKPYNDQLLEAIDRLARLTVALNLDLLPEVPLSEDQLDEGFWDALKNLGKSALGGLKGLNQKIASSPEPWKELARSVGLPKLQAVAQQSGKSVGEVLKDLAKHAGQGHHGGHGYGGYGGRYGPGYHGRGNLQAYKELASQSGKSPQEIAQLLDSTAEALNYRGVQELIHDIWDEAVDENISQWEALQKYAVQGQASAQNKPAQNKSNQTTQAQGPATLNDLATRYKDARKAIKVAVKAMHGEITNFPGGPGGAVAQDYLTGLDELIKYLKKEYDFVNNSGQPPPSPQIQPATSP